MIFLIEDFFGICFCSIPHAWVSQANAPSIVIHSWELLPGTGESYLGQETVLIKPQQLLPRTIKSQERRVKNNLKDATTSLKLSRETLFAIELVTEPSNLLERSSGVQRILPSLIRKTRFWLQVEVHSTYKNSRKRNLEWDFAQILHDIK